MENILVNKSMNTQTLNTKYLYEINKYNQIFKDFIT